MRIYDAACDSEHGVICSMNQTPGGLWASEKQFVAVMLGRKLRVVHGGEQSSRSVEDSTRNIYIKNSPLNLDLRM